MAYRPLRVSGLIQEELGKILLREVDLASVLITITSVDIDKKMERAIVYISVLATGPNKGEKNIEAALRQLEKRQGYFQFLLTRKLNIKPMPTIIFKRDRGLERAAKVEGALLHE